MEDERIEKLAQLEPERLRAQLENLSTEELRDVALKLACRLENKC